MAKKEVTVRLRKWYEDRGEFDQETDKAENGLITFTDFKCGNPETADLIEISEMRSKMHDSLRKAAIINPLEGVVELSLTDVFVEPIISDTSAFGTDRDEANVFVLGELLASQDSLIFFGRPDYGKTSLLEHAYSVILADDKQFEGKIPIFMKFSELPRNNPDGIKHFIRRQLDEYASKEQVEKYLSQGRMIILIDDFYDRQEPNRDHKIETLKQFSTIYTKCRYILTATEYITQASPYEALKWHDEFKTSAYFINSFSTSKIRQLIIRINTAQAIDVNAILDQILFYFNQLEIPVTPLTVTLFIGVLFRDKGRKNIQNEAYLIENYLETILEKLDSHDRVHDLDFREKESFLAYIAFRMTEQKSFEWTVNEFEREKLVYFEQLDEDVPKSHVFEDFFSKGILQDSGGYISFKFKFWFYFFLAKAMEKDDQKKAFILGLPEYLNYSTALGYKAGLSRNDGSLLAVIDERISKEADTTTLPESIRELEDSLVDKALGKITSQVVAEIKQRNKAELVDQVRDKSLSTDDAPQTIEVVEDSEKFGQLLTLHSDVIRNTREIDSSLKRKYLQNNVSHYVSLMWTSLQAFHALVNVLDISELPALLGKGTSSKKQEVRIKQMVDGSQRILMQVVPLSMMFYMIDHLASPKLARPIGKLLDGEANEMNKVFYLSLLYKLDQKKGAARMKEFVKTGSSMVCDHLLFTYLRFYCNENELNNDALSEVIEILELVRNKHRSRQKTAPPFVNDTFAADFRKRINLKGPKRLKNSK